MLETCRPGYVDGPLVFALTYRSDLVQYKTAPTPQTWLANPYTFFVAWCLTLFTTTIIIIILTNFFGLRLFKQTEIV
jgi:hypothetical protein